MKKVASSPRKVKRNHKKKASRKKKVSRKKKASVYRLRNWSEYNQALKQRGDVTFWFSEAAIRNWYYQGPTQQGSQFRYSDLSIQTVLTLKVVYHQTLRQAEGFAKGILDLMGLSLDVPDFSTLSRRQASLKVDLPVQASRRAVHVVVDSTGLKVYGEGEWKVRQYGFSKRRTWRKLHLGVDEATGEFLAVTLTTNSVDDASQVDPLLDQIRRPVSAFGGDGSYDKQKVYETLDNPPHQDEPIRPIIPPRSNAKIWRHGNCQDTPLPRDEHLRTIRKVGVRRWKQESGYHRRSIAETGVCRYKRIIGPQLWARRLERQQTEVKIGCSILNRMAWLGRPDSYKVELAA
jgi:hypothetical protein